MRSRKRRRRPNTSTSSSTGVMKRSATGRTRRNLRSISSSIGLHYQQGKQALAAGKHIHFNKTMTTTVAEATDLIDTARAKGLKIVASPGEMLRPHNQYIKKLVADGALGTLCWAVAGAAFGTYHERE